MLKTQSATSPAGVREFLRKYAVFLIIPLFLGAILILFSSFRPPPRPNAYFTIDDGASYFVAPLRAAPFTYQGKDAVQAMLFTSDRGASKFIGYLLKYTDDAKPRAEARFSDPNPAAGQIPADWTEVKKPGPGSWVKGGGLPVSGPNGMPAFPVGAD